MITHEKPSRKKHTLNTDYLSNEYSLFTGDGFNVKSDVGVDNGLLHVLIRVKHQDQHLPDSQLGRLQTELVCRHCKCLESLICFKMQDI